MFNFLSFRLLKYHKLPSLQWAYLKGQRGKIVWFCGRCQVFLKWCYSCKSKFEESEAEFLLYHWNPCKNTMVGWTYSSALLTFWKMYRNKLDSNCNWTHYKTVVSCSFICSTTIKLRWLLGLNHSVCYLFPSNCTHSCLVIFYSLHKEGKRGALLWCSVILVLITVYVCFLKKKKEKKRTSINVTRMSLNTFLI